MKNIFKLFGITAFVAVIVFLMAGCGLFDDDYELINGVWDRGDIVITINDSNAVFSEIKSHSGWKTLLDNGTIKIGDLKFRNIKKSSDRVWNLQELTYPSSNTTNWSETGTLTLSSNGRTITVVTPNVETPSTTYTKQ